MNLVDFAIQVVTISASGVISPGPLFLTNILYGTQQGARSGLKVAYGHSVVELPLIILLAAGLFSTAILSQYSDVIGLVGGIAILGFGSLKIIELTRKKKSTRSFTTSKKSPFIAGVVFSALNPFFLLWWFTVGLKLIADSVAFGPTTGIPILFGLHIWMDYIWLIGTAHLASKGRFVIKSKYYRLLLLVLSAVLVYYGISFMVQAIF